MYPQSFGTVQTWRQKAKKLTIIIQVSCPVARLHVHRSILFLEGMIFELSARGNAICYGLKQPSKLGLQRDLIFARIML